MGQQQKNSHNIKKFQTILTSFRHRVLSWEKSYPHLFGEISALIPENKYPLEHTIVYNTDLDKISGEMDIKLIVVADNPGKDEQLDETQAYLVGKSGVVMKNFLLKHDIVHLPEQQIIILNKTPIHTASTLLLKKLKQHKKLVEESQHYMAQLLYEIHTLFPVPVWIVGMSEIRRKGLFEPWLNEINRLYEPKSPLREKLLCFKHFAYGNFTKDINKTLVEHPLLTVEEAIEKRGREYADTIL
ncbi:hypothetical protein KAH37_10275 [bacterium]|nr:hypothetical protein [bacterium]